MSSAHQFVQNITSTPFQLTYITFKKNVPYYGRSWTDGFYISDDEERVKLRKSYLWISLSLYCENAGIRPISGGTRRPYSQNTSVGLEQS